MSTWHIFAGGVIGDTGFIRIYSDEKVICADSGLVYAQRLGVEPDIIVGDFDSYNGTIPAGPELHISRPEKDDTDTMLAVKIAIDRGADRIMLYGGLGARFDHTMANIQTLVYAYSQGCDMTISDSDNEITVQGRGVRSYPVREGWYLSVFSLTDSTILDYMRGFRYPLENYELKSSFPLGVSNEITADTAEISVKDGLLLVVRSKK